MTYTTIDEMVADLVSRPVEANGHIYHPIPFPEFAALRSSANEAAVQEKGRRVRAVLERRRSLRLPYARMLDVGANAGYFTFSLAPMLESVTAYEPNERYSAIGQSLAPLRAPNVEWRARAFDEAEVGSERWDVALMLSTFQWISRGDEALPRARRLLRSLSERTSCLIFEIGLNQGASAITTQKRNHVAAIYRLLSDSTAYPAIRYAGCHRMWPERSPWRGWRHMFVCSHDDPRFPQPRTAILKRLAV
jgi:ubiquinone/menaquinone biosynthesis C-methylase UbiE